MACIAMAYVVIDGYSPIQLWLYIVMALQSYGPYSYCLYSYGLFSYGLQDIRHVNQACHVMRVRLYIVVL